ncbi:MAG: DUF975 family protein [Butyrivibrio sp.]|nr:DUF975 family protein [Butyrivibrio sp.]
MNYAKKTSELKSIARERLLGKYSTVIGATVSIMLIQMSITEIVSQVIGYTDITFFIINEITTVILNILYGVFVSGLVYMNMNIVYDQPVSYSDIFFGIKQNPQKAVSIQSLLIIGDILVLLGAAIVTAAYSFYTITPAIILTGFVFIIAGLIIGILISLNFGLSFYILHDFPDKKPADILKLSKKLMKGNRRNLFVLYFSFIPFYLFGIITLFVPLLWIVPYKNASVAAFYQNIISAKRR